MISNTVFWRPPGNRPPTPPEINACEPFLTRLIELVNPKVLVALGGPAAKILLKEELSISKLRGKWLKFHNSNLQKTIDATVMFHPKYLLSTPKQKRYAWIDLLNISKKLSSKD